MEYMLNGDLQSMLEADVHFTFEEQLRFAFHILQALYYLHSRGISHRDLKPENILFDQNFNPKIADFGLSRENSSNLCTFCGSPAFMAPEVIQETEYDGRKADMWAFGVTLNILVSRRYPWKNISNEMQFIHAIKHNKLEIEIDQHAIIGDLLTNSLVIDPNARATSSYLLDLIANRQKNKCFISKLDFQRKEYQGQFLPPLYIKNNMSSFFNNNNGIGKRLKKYNLVVRKRVVESCMNYK
ncbi:CAMK family protein kinase [Trichomonas vaginalis G3]|uniref:CAMK family protein kinase n=1 Tax=Trichomonas vaginalis (strain ATCC PRA-98 / G3) TaxID=412133 RepID=A2ETC1_TRIV3|nr:protein serine/threonine kinase protein [Trichomonas vaginalis G3]EAY04111.1 CAMK family protein kinase [Trichomonas vaginalis G3]KAI5503861.1 protein serine/threonine kinase protein [Trichomonas vaginalis G3]|eukprot:XP_001316334.1 CAMK family protein kinase [Trichomonas vaginalis G3]